MDEQLKVNVQEIDKGIKEVENEVKEDKKEVKEIKTEKKTVKKLKKGKVIMVSKSSVIVQDDNGNGFRMSNDKNYKLGDVVNF